MRSRPECDSSRRRKAPVCARGIEIQANDGFQLLGEVWIVAAFEALDAMRLQSVRPPDTAHAGFGNAHRTRHAAARPVRGSGGLGLRRAGNQLADDIPRNFACPSRPGASLSGPSTPKPKTGFAKGPTCAAQLPSTEQFPYSAFLRRPAKQCGCAAPRAPQRSAGPIASPIPAALPNSIESSALHA